MNGNGAEAIYFYEQAIEAKIPAVQKFGDLPEDEETHFQEEERNRIMKAHL